MVMGRIISTAPPAGFTNGGPATEIRLATVAPPSGSLGQRGRRLWEMVQKRLVKAGQAPVKAGQAPVKAGRLLVTPDALVVDAGTELGGRLEIPWGSIRKAIVDDGSRWGYVAAVCRFPVYDLRSNGSGSGTLIGPLWSRAAALMPPACPVAALDPVPEQSPNLALIFEPGLSVRMPQDGNGDRRVGADSMIGLLLRVDDPDVARAVIASRIEFGDLDHDDLEYLGRAAGSSRSGSGASAANGSLGRTSEPSEQAGESTRSSARSA
jgi:hypothetical protein